MEVLLVDDEPDFLFQARAFLEDRIENLELHTANSLRKARQLEKKHDYDVIVSDYLLVESTGLEFLREIRERGEDTPFIIITGHGSEEVAMRAIEWDVDRYLKKTESPKELFQNLAEILKQTIGEGKAEGEHLIAWIEKKTYGPPDPAKKDLKDLANETGFKITKLETEPAPWNSENKGILKAYTNTFEKIPKTKAPAVKDWKKKTSWDNTILDSGVRIEGKTDKEKTERLRKEKN